MKDIKSVMIGFLLATSMFLFMGATTNSNQVTEYRFEWYPNSRGGGQLLNKETGAMYINDTVNNPDILKKRKWDKVDLTSDNPSIDKVFENTK